MADIENPGPEKDGLVVMVAERSKFVRIAAMCTLLFFGFVSLFISLLLVQLFQYTYPGTKLAVVALVMGILGMPVALSWIWLFYRFTEDLPILDEDTKGRGRLIDRFVQFHVDFFKVLVR